MNECNFTAHVIVQLYTDFTSKETSLEVFRAAIHNILEDESYKLNPISPAAEARKVAESLLKWSLNEHNNEKVNKFVQGLFEELEKPIIALLHL